MPKKPKFKPEVIRIALNPEQAVLTCDCYNNSLRYPISTNKWLPLVARNACALTAEKTISEGSACANIGITAGTGDIATKTGHS